MLNVIPCGMKALGKILHLQFDLRLKSLPLFIHGSPGVGKSDRVRHFTRHDLPLHLSGRGEWPYIETGGSLQPAGLIDLRLTTLEAVDLRGLCWPDKEAGITRWLRPEFLPQPGCRPTVILLDELTTAEPRLQASSYELVLDRRIGKYQLPDNVMVIAAGNDVEDGAIAYEMGSALADRFLHVRLEPSADGWIAWAMENGIHPWVITFIKTKPEYLNSCGGQDSSDHLVKPTPRSWKNVSEVLQVTDNDDEVRSIMINGLVGEASTVVFKHVVEELAGLPTMERLLKMQPREIGRAIPANISALYGLTYSLTAFVNKIEDMERAIMIFDEVAAVQDALPRAEIQAIGMEMLLDKAYRHNLLNSLIGSKTYKSRYAAKAMELAS